jgi:hypothetical protein
MVAALIMAKEVQIFEDFLREPKKKLNSSPPSYSSLIPSQSNRESLKLNTTPKV